MADALMAVVTGILLWAWCRPDQLGRDIARARNAYEKERHDAVPHS